jgi:ABC-type sugar transport system ATPase subunit
VLTIHVLVLLFRMTLLLGPPGSGKTTLLRALAGKLDEDLKVLGKVTYNGHRMNEFVPQRTAAYISQHDLHIGEMTVRETLAFSARCQGVGTRYGMQLNVGFFNTDEWGVSSLGQVLKFVFFDQKCLLSCHEGKRQPTSSLIMILMSI